MNRVHNSQGLGQIFEGGLRFPQALKTLLAPPHLKTRDNVLSTTALQIRLNFVKTEMKTSGGTTLQTRAISSERMYCRVHKFGVALTHTALSTQGKHLGLSVSILQQYLSQQANALSSTHCWESMNLTMTNTTYSKWVCKHVRTATQRISAEVT